MPLSDVLLADRLGLADALPCRPDQLPDPGLSERLLALAHLLQFRRLLPWLIPHMLRLHRLMEGNIAAWRLTA